MPHIPEYPPGRLAGISSKLPPELGIRPPPERKPPEPAKPERSAKNPFMDRISVNKHDVDPAAVFKHMFGRELETNEQSGVSNLVPAATPGGAAAR